MVDDQVFVHGLACLVGNGANLQAGFLQDRGGLVERLVGDVGDDHLLCLGVAAAQCGICAAKSCQQGDDDNRCGDDLALAALLAARSGLAALLGAAVVGVGVRAGLIGIHGADNTRRARCNAGRGGGAHDGGGCRGAATCEVVVKRLLHLVCCGVALARVFGHRLQDDGLELCVYRGVDGAWRDGLLAYLLHGNAHGVRAVKGELAGAGLVHDDAQAVKVARPGKGLALRLLGAYVVCRAQDVGVLRHIRVARLRDAKVHDLNVAVGLDHDVGRFDVAVDDVVAVCHAQGAAHLRAYLGDLARVDAAAPLDGAFEIGAAHVLHDDVVHAVVLAPVVDVDDVGAREVGRSLGLLPKTRGKGAVCRVLRKHHLDGDRTAQGGVLCFEDLGHAADTYALGDRVALSKYLFIHVRLLA